MNKKKAISIIQNQINKLESSKDNRTYSWIIETRTYIESFFGEKSHQSDYFKYYSWSNSPNFNPDEQEKNTIHYLKDCINTINNLGLYKAPVENWFSKLPNWAINLGLPALCLISFSLGILFTNNDNKELRSENKKLKNELLLISSDTITNQHKNLSNNPK
tara:strand:- start:870 stop:1352 length:483 start_codon:yes stop_codon:yes gene_type:complete